MFETNDIYTSEMRRPIRGQGHIHISVEVIDPEAAGDSTVSENGQVFYSDTGLLVYDAVPEQTYGSFEPGRWVADGEQLVPSESRPIAQGYISSAISGRDGIFSSPPTLRFSFSEQHTFPGLTLTFDPCCADWPKTIAIKAYRASTLVQDMQVYPTGPVFEIIPEGNLGFQNITRIDLLFLDSGKPYRRARLQRIVFSYLLDLYTQNIDNAIQTMEIDPLSRKLPKNTFRFDLINLDGRYDPDDPTGIWRDLEERIPINISFGVKRSTGMRWREVSSMRWATLNSTTWQSIYSGQHVEWVQAGRYYLTSMPSAPGDIAIFQCQDTLSLATGSYYKGVLFQTKTMRELAIEVLQNADLPKAYDGSDPWKLWDGLSQITTTAPLPIASNRELLQLIAHASRCVLFTDRDGFIRIEPVPVKQTEEYLDFHSILGKPTVTKTAACKRVQVKQYSYTPSTSDKVEIHNNDYSVSGSRPVHLEFGGLYSDVEITVSRGTYEAYVYAAAADVFLFGNGEITLTVEGQAVNTSFSYVASEVENPAKNAETETVSNELIVNESTAQQVADCTRDYLMNRSTYEFDHRGDPALDPLDMVYLQSRYTDKFPARLLYIRTEFDGTFQSRKIAKKVDSEK